MKIAALISGGKDSLYATWLASKKHRISCFVAIKSENPESYMFHFPNIDLVKLQAKSAGIPLIFKTTKGEKERELEDLKVAIKEAKQKYKIQGIVSGALASNYQKQRIDKICKELSLKSITPLWHKDQEKYMYNLIKKFKVKIVSVAAEGLDKSWIGKILTKANLGKLRELSKKYKFNISGEGGEYETSVIDCPLFKEHLISH